MAADPMHVYSSDTRTVDIEDFVPGGRRTYRFTNSNMARLREPLEDGPDVSEADEVELERIASTGDILRVDVEHGFRGTQELAKALAANSSITMLSVNNEDPMELDPDVVMALLRGPAPVRRIKLATAEIGSRGFAALGEALAHDRTLEVLDMYNSLAAVGNDRGMELGHIGRALRTNTTLKALRQWGYEAISDEDAVELGAGLRANSTLAALCVGVRSEAAGRTILEALADNTGLRFLELEPNLHEALRDTLPDVCSRLYGVLAESMGRNRTLLGARVTTFVRPAMRPPGLEAMLERNRSIFTRWSRCGGLVTWRRAVEHSARAFAARMGRLHA